MMRNLQSVLLLCGLIAMATGCSSGDLWKTDTEATVEQSNMKTYDVRGRIVEVRNDGRTLVVDHEEIRGYMAAMTMPFTLGEGVSSSGLAAGDAVSFTYHVSDSGMWIEGIEVLDSRAVAESPTVAAEPEYVDPSDDSVYWLTDEWTTQDNERIRLASYEGHPVLVSMIFTNCGYACPMIVRDMKRVASHLSPEVAEDVRFLLVSLDPERDTPAQMARFAEAHRLDADKWTLVTGSSSQVRSLAAMLGIRYRKESDGQFAHSNIISILDPSGVIVHQQKGLDLDGADAADALFRLAKSD